LGEAADFDIGKSILRNGGEKKWCVAIDDVRRHVAGAEPVSDRPEPHEMVLLDRGPVFLYVLRPEGTVSSNVAIFIDIFAIQHSEEAGVARQGRRRGYGWTPARQ
jgi:hypothetical protein